MKRRYIYRCDEPVVQWLHRHTPCWLIGIEHTRVGRNTTDWVRVYFALPIVMRRRFENSSNIVARIIRRFWRWC